MTLNSDIGSCTVAEVMGTDLLTLTPQTSVASARRLVDVSGNIHLIVIQDGTLAGIVSDEDLQGADADACVADCMSSPVLCISAETTLQEAVDIMGENNVDCLPVVTGAYLVGMVTRKALSIAEEPSEISGCAACGDGSGANAPTEKTPATPRTAGSKRPGPSRAGPTIVEPDDDGDVYLCGRCRSLIDAAGRC